MFPTPCKVHEMILLNRLEAFAKQKMQFGFQKSVGCIEAFFVILEIINHKLEPRSKVFSCFLDVRKAFDTVWIDGLLGVGGRIWLAIKDLYTRVYTLVLKPKSSTQVPFPGSLVFHKVQVRGEYFPLL